MFDLFAFVYGHWQARIKQTIRLFVVVVELTETKWVIFQQWCEVHPAFLCIKNYSNIYKEMSALSVADQNLEAVSQRG